MRPSTIIASRVFAARSYGVAIRVGRSNIPGRDPEREGA
jgi:hypothetical protein